MSDMSVSTALAGRRVLVLAAAAVAFVVAHGVLAWLILLAGGFAAVAAHDWLGSGLGVPGGAFSVVAVVAFLAVRGGAKAGRAVAEIIAGDTSIRSLFGVFAAILLSVYVADYLSGVYDIFDLLPMAIGGFAAVLKGDY
jgi:hypothetical protein